MDRENIETYGIVVKWIILVSEAQEIPWDVSRVLTYITLGPGAHFVTLKRPCDDLIAPSVSLGGPSVDLKRTLSGLFSGH